MTEKSKPPVVDIDPKAIARWDTEGGAPASGDQSTIKRPKRPRELNQWAKRMLDIATGEGRDAAPTPEEQGKDPAAVSLGRRGGLKGGKARAASLSHEQRREIAQKAAASRWAPADKKRPS
jgi:hypothetical protein